MADRFRTPRKEKQWIAIPSFIQQMTADGTFVTSSRPFTSVQTVMRMLGEYTIAPDAATVAQDMVKIAVAIGKVSTDAFTAGAASLPDPAGEAEYPWLYWAEHSFFFGSTSADPNMVSSSLRHTFDIRSMRKFRPGESIVFVTQYVDLNGAPPIRFMGSQVRLLTTIH